MMGSMYLYEPYLDEMSDLHNHDCMWSGGCFACEKFPAPVMQQQPQPQLQQPDDLITSQQSTGGAVPLGIGASSVGYTTLTNTVVQRAESPKKTAASSWNLPLFEKPLIRMSEHENQANELEVEPSEQVNQSISLEATASYTNAVHDEDTFSSSVVSSSGSDTNQSSSISLPKPKLKKSTSSSRQCSSRAKFKTNSRKSNAGKHNLSSADNKKLRHREVEKNRHRQLQAMVKTLSERIPGRLDKETQVQTMKRAARYCVYLRQISGEFARLHSPVDKLKDRLENIYLKACDNVELIMSQKG